MLAAGMSAVSRFIDPCLIRRTVSIGPQWVSWLLTYSIKLEHEGLLAFLESRI